MAADRTHRGDRGRNSRTRTLTRVLLAPMLVLAGCGAPDAPGTPPGALESRPASPSPRPTAPALFPMTLTDDDGVSLTLRSAPERIVTWGPSNTEILFALGEGERIVGVSGPFDDHPAEAKTIEEIGGRGGVEPNVERVVALEPDLVLNGFLGGEEWKARLRDLGVSVFSIYAEDFDGVLDDIRTVGMLIGAPGVADALTGDMAAREEEIQAAVAAEPRVSCFFEAGYPELYTVGPQDFPFDLLLRAGCDPVTEEADAPYPLWSIERLVADDPEVYILTSEAGASPMQVAQRPGFAGIAAVRAGRVYLIDSDLVTRPGPRVIEGMEQLAEFLHPDVM
ncbi:MAG: ABC transporter substrate-binding protein [Actinobacteria bacterium]|nr:ABC transporter substrate-binding protein [Actinomycetota bacterium]